MSNYLVLEVRWWDTWKYGSCHPPGTPTPPHSGKRPLTSLSYTWLAPSQLWKAFLKCACHSKLCLNKDYLEKVSWWYWSGFALMHFALTFIRPLCRSWRHWGWNLARLHPSPIPILCFCCHTIPYQTALNQTKFSSSAFPGLACCFSCFQTYRIILHHTMPYRIV